MSRFIGPIVREDTGEQLAGHVELADTYWTRLAGLQFRRNLPGGHSLLIVPCGSIHTAFMRFTIDAVFLDNRGYVSKVVHSVRPWRIATASKVSAVLELPAGGACLLETGVRLALPDDSRRESVRFLEPAAFAARLQ